MDVRVSYADQEGRVKGVRHALCLRTPRALQGEKPPRGGVPYNGRAHLWMHHGGRWRYLQIDSFVTPQPIPGIMGWIYPSCPPLFLATPYGAKLN